MIEIGQWLVENDMIHADDGDVGLSTADDGADPIRIWAGDAKDAAPNFKVTRAGILTAVAAIFMSAAGYPKVSMNLNSNLIQAFSDANNHVDFSPQVGTAPGIAWVVAGALNAYLQSTSAGPLLTSFDTTSITLQPAENLNLLFNAGGNLRVNGANGQTASISYVKNVVAGVPSFGSLNFNRGILTSYT